MAMALYLPNQRRPLTILRYRGKSVKRQALNNGVFRLQKVEKRRNAAEIANNIAALEILQVKFHNI